MTWHTIALVALAGTLAWACNSDDDPQRSTAASGGAKGTAGAAGAIVEATGGASAEAGAPSLGGAIAGTAGMAGAASTVGTPGTAGTTGTAGAAGSGSSGDLVVYDVVETFREPMTQPNDTIFTGTFTYEVKTGVVSNLAGTLTQSMTKVNGVYGSPMTTVSLEHQLSSVPVTLDGTAGLLVTTFALATNDTFTGGGFAPGGTQYYGLNEGMANNHNAYAMIFVSTSDPTVTLTRAQLDKLAYADCTAGGMMMSTCMTGTTVAGYGRAGTMGGYPTSQGITRR